MAGQLANLPAWHFATMTDPQNPTPAADFPPATQEAWRGLVDAVLKGAPFARLESRTYDGLTIEPLYARDAAATALAGRAPGAAWTVMQRVDHPDPAAANAQALDDLQNGATGLVLVFAGSVSANGFGLDPSPATLKRALDGIDLTAVAIDLNLSPATRHVVREFAALVKSRGIAPASRSARQHQSDRRLCRVRQQPAEPGTSLRLPLPRWSASLPAPAFADRSPLPTGASSTMRAARKRRNSLSRSPARSPICARWKRHGMALDAARDAIYFRLSADADQFLTMAKFRAARKLWARIEEACGLTPKPAMIAAETAWRMMTKRDPYVNMLRTTIAVAAAGLGGADAITVLPHTAPLGLPDAFARRVARNTQLMLLEESNLARVADPAAGSGALEAMTHELCAAAWSLFQEIEQAGGAWAALETGLIQRHAAAVRAERENAVARRTDILTGTNDYPNINEALPAVLDVAPAALPKDEAAVTAAALPRIRLAEPFEQLRDASDKSWPKPARGRKYSSPRSASPPTSMPALTSPRISSRPAASRQRAAKKAPPRLLRPSRHRAPRSPACADRTRATTATPKPPPPRSRRRGRGTSIWPDGPARWKKTCGRRGCRASFTTVAMSWRHCKPPTIF